MREREIAANHTKAATNGSGRMLSHDSSGAFVLAAAGVLDGRVATTHWRYAQAFRERFPRVMLQPDVLYVDEGDIVTAAGSAAGIAHRQQPCAAAMCGAYRPHQSIGRRFAVVAPPGDDNQIRRGQQAQASVGLHSQSAARAQHAGFALSDAKSI